MQKNRHQYDEALAGAQKLVASDPENEKNKNALERLKKQEFLIEYYELITEVARRLTEWSLQREKQGLPSYLVGTGGGPGMMSAANEGAVKAGGRSVGLGISLPFEDHLNEYVSPDLAFEFHYYFTRKYWMAYKCMGLVVCPGGVGTCDELFELLTLRQKGIIRRKLPIILAGSKFWKECINWEQFVEFGMISRSDYEQLHFCDEPGDALNILVAGIENMEHDPDTHIPKKMLR